MAVPCIRTRVFRQAEVPVKMRRIRRNRLIDSMRQLDMR